MFNVFSRKYFQVYNYNAFIYGCRNIFSSLNNRPLTFFQCVGILASYMQSSESLRV